MKQIYKDEVEDCQECCAYCGTEISSSFDYRGCCGEVHSCQMIQYEGDWYVDGEEIVVLPGCRPLTEEQKDSRNSELQMDVEREAK